MPDDGRDWRDVLGSALPPEERPKPEPNPPPVKPAPATQSKGSAPMPQQNQQQDKDSTPWHQRDGVNAIVKDCGSSAKRGTLNFNLLFHRYLPKAAYNKGGDNSEVMWFLASAAAAFYTGQASLLNAVREQSCNSIRGLCEPRRTDDVTIAFTERLAIGLGGPSAFDAGITLHHLTGTPYLPASSLKGLARATALEELAAEYGVPYLEGKEINRCGLKRFERLLEWAPPRRGDSAESKAARAKLDEMLDQIKKSDPLEQASPLRKIGVNNWEELARGAMIEKRIACYRLAFGTQSARGQVVFSDAHPINLNRLDPDLVNPHYGPYYRNPKNEQPADYHNPIPALFLTVPKGTQFQFVLGSFPVDPTQLIDEAALRAQVLKWLREGLEGMGIGAKTAVGYGAAKIVAKPIEATP